MRIQRSVTLLVSIVMVILLNVAMAKADEPYGPKPPKPPKETYTPRPSTPTPTVTVTPTPTPTRSQGTPYPVLPVGRTDNPPKSWFWVYWVTAILLFLILLIWLLLRRRRKPTGYTPTPARPSDGTYTPPVDQQSYPDQQRRPDTYS